MTDVWNKVYFGNTVSKWVFAAIILMICLVLASTFKHIIVVRLKKWSSKTQTMADDFIIHIIEKNAVPVLYFVAFYFSFNTLAFPKNISNIFRIVFSVFVTYFVLRTITVLVKHLLISSIKTEEVTQGAKEKQVKGILIVVNIVIWVVGGIFLIDNLGYKVSTLLAGLGIGGIAIALAAQTILGDLFSYFVIFFDRPFEIGDFIIVDDKMGTIEYIGIKTTRIRALSGEQLICSNTFLTNARVHNYKRMQERRVVFKIGVVYETGYAHLQKIPEMVKAIISSTKDTRFDRGHFSGFGDFSLNFEFVYYILSSDYNIFMDKQQAIYLEIVKKFGEESINFAYPTQTILFNTNEPKPTNKLT